MKEQTVSAALAHRRSVRVYDPEKPLPNTAVEDSLKAASLAPNSSNLQLWEFHHIEGETALKDVAACCFNQPAAKTAQEMVVFVVRRDLWRERIADNIAHVKRSFEKSKDRDPKKEKGALSYYGKIIPQLYGGASWLGGLLKYAKAQLDGIKKTTYREVRQSDMRIVAHKSTALAAQSFMLSMAAKGYDTCPMEGFDSKRLKQVLGLPATVEINMVVSCGIRKEEGIYGERFRVPFEKVYHKH